MASSASWASGPVASTINRVPASAASVSTYAGGPPAVSEAAEEEEEWPPRSPTEAAPQPSPAAVAAEPEAAAEAVAGA